MANRRPPRKERGYDEAWLRLRAWFLSRNPLCVMCHEEGRAVAAEVVDHIKPISEDPSKRLDTSNLRSLCKRHHDQRTALEQTAGKKMKQPVDANGVPSGWGSDERDEGRGVQISAAQSRRTARAVVKSKT